MLQSWKQARKKVKLDAAGIMEISCGHLPESSPSVTTRDDATKTLVPTRPKTRPPLKPDYSDNMLVFKRVLRERKPKPRSPPSIDDKPRIVLDKKFHYNVHLKRGHCLTIEAKIKGFPRPNVSWYHHEHEITTNDLYIVEIKKRTTSLTIKEGNDFVKGIYRIVARNEKGLAGNYINIIIEEKPMIFFEHKFLERVEVKLGEASSIKAHIVSYTEPSISCYYNGQEIRTDENFIVEIKAKMVIVTIKEKNALVSGILSIVAENEHGLSRKSINIDIVGEPEIILEERFKEPIKLRMGDSLIIEAKILGFPMPSISCFRDIDEITSDDNYIIEMEDNIFRITIKEGNAWVHGEHRLIAKNDHGLTTVVIKIDVIKYYYEYECYSKDNKVYYECELL